ncbi:MAG TPA: hypothetical protein VL633_01265 [Bacteroidota bacterium]|jgi:hypothetical protein|nr:hypothetical protein [Bacteroidota bacterium]
MEKNHELIREQSQLSLPLDLRGPEFIRCFDRLFRSFRQQVFECYGERGDVRISRAVTSVQYVDPGFDPSNLTEPAVLSVLDVLESVIQSAGVFKRSRLRQTAVTLISDLYNKQYDLLEQHNAIDRVEQAYYRLKK